ncbi:hypothetical protein [Noviherbaspirillum soli]|uniref:hypothetical protein n=1 Tax=Noviherbaspirillum soli TaxID=1064518 RepID=UPI00188CBFE3|nr:hypothetical protein [Noviherbaspirillum soli]
MTSKPTTSSEAGLSIVLVRPETGLSGQTLLSLKRRCVFPPFLRGPVDDWSCSVKQQQRLGLTCGLPDSSLCQGMMFGLKHAASQAFSAQYANLKTVICPGQIWAALALRRRLVNCLECLISMLRAPCGTTLKALKTLHRCLNFYPEVV